MLQEPVFRGQAGRREAAVLEADGVDVLPVTARCPGLGVHHAGDECDDQWNKHPDRPHTVPLVQNYSREIIVLSL